MRVLVCGGTGFVGGALVPMLRARRHEVLVLSRSREAPARLTAVGARMLVGDLLSPAGIDLGDDRVDAIVLLAAPRIFGKRLGKRRFLALKAELTAIYANAIDLASRLGCPIVITGGTAFRTTGDEIADESWPLVRVGATRIGEEIDPLVAAAVAAGAPKVVWMLPGQIYGPGGPFMMMVEMARRGRGAILGDGGNCIPRVHVEDCAAAYAAALEHLDALATGERFIVADDVSCSSREFSERLAELLRAPRPEPAPTFVVKLVLGRLLFETATMHCKVSNAKARRVLGWEPRYPSFREGLAATVEAIARGSAPIDQSAKR
jgi:nucleoside-diphosphate-sugar epimerase